ncbi:MAG: ABC transporter permease [candidate division Zixibacteria bacterium]
MIRHFFKLAFRQIRKNKLYNSVNIIGLSIGLAGCIMIFSYVRSELSIDNYHDKGDRIFRVCARFEDNGKELWWGSSNGVTADALKSDFPEVEYAVRLGRGPGSSIAYESEKFRISRISYADPSVFNVFTWPLITGNIETVLADPHSIVISEDAATRVFDSQDPVGKVLKLADGADYTVTGIMENIPSNSHLRPEALCSFSTLYTSDGPASSQLTDWMSFNFRTYALLRNGVDYKSLTAKVSNLTDKYAREKMDASGLKCELFLHPLRDIYLRPIGQNTGPLFYVYIFTGLALIILVIACVNFANIVTANSMSRVREVGMRKVLGAGRRKIMIQFLGEAMLLCTIALLVALVLVELTLPHVSAITGEQLSFSAVETFWTVPAMVGLTLFIGFIAGSYPAFFLSSSTPTNLMKGQTRTGRPRTLVRNAMIIGQFTASCALIVLSGIVGQQLTHLKDVDTGFDKENVLVVQIGRNPSVSPQIVRNTLANVPGVVGAAASSSIPGWGGPTNGKIPEGYPRNQEQRMLELNVDENYIPIMGMEIVRGRNFSSESGASERNAVIINETAAKQFGWDDPIGKTIMSIDPESSSEEYEWLLKTVIGVVKDFSQRSVATNIEPVYIGNDLDYPPYYNKLSLITVRFEPDQVESVVAGLETNWKSIIPDEPFNYFFLDENFDWQFGSIERTKDIFSYATILAIGIACLGLFGLVSFLVEQRTKEIGIRKVLGSSVPRVIWLVARNFIILVAIANALAWPAAYLLAKGWLEEYAVRTQIGLELFFLAGVITLVLAGATICVRAVNAARANPVDALKHE